MSETNSVFNQENASNVTDLSQAAQKPTHYLNLKLVDAQGNEHNINQGIALGGKSEKRISPSLIKAFEIDPERAFTITGTIKSAETEVIDIEL